MNNYIENSKSDKDRKENLGSNIENKKTFIEKVKSLFKWKKDNETRLEGNVRENETILRDMAVEDRLHDLEKIQRIQGSNIDIKDELNNLLVEGKVEKDSKSVVKEKDLAQEILQNERFSNRPDVVVNEINNGANRVIQDIENGDTEQNPIAKFLWGIAKNIMGTEKEKNIS